MLRTCILFFFTTILGAPASANVILEDGRVHITIMQQALGLKNGEVKKIRESTGKVYCPGTTYGNGLLTSGALIHADNVVVTTAHSFIDEFGRKREPLSECYFQTQGLSPERASFDFSFAGSEIVQDWTFLNRVNDYAVVRLQMSGLQRGRAFAIAPGSALFVGQQLLLISAKPKRAKFPFSGYEPIAQSCGVRKLFLVTPFNTTLFYGDCDITPGASGSVGLIRMAEGGELLALGLSSGGGGPEVDGHAYDEAAESYSFHIAFRKAVVDAIVRISGKPL